MLELLTNVLKMTVKDVIPAIEEMAVELGPDVKSELERALEIIGGVEEVLMLSTAYSFSSLIIKKLGLECDEEDDITTNGVWWYNIGEVEDNPFIMVTNGTVRNYFILVKEII